MSCYFVVDTYIDESRGRGSYDDYIEEVKPIVENFGDRNYIELRQRQVAFQNLELLVRYLHRR